MLPGNCVGQLIDKVWMIFNAVLPLVISYVRSNNEYPLEFVITSDEPNYLAPGQEMTPLSGAAKPIVNGDLDRLEGRAEGKFKQRNDAK
jgi:hypothetical protein